MSESDPAPENRPAMETDEAKILLERAAQKGDAHALEETVIDAVKHEVKEDINENRINEIESSLAARSDVKDEDSVEKKEGDNQTLAEAADTENVVNGDESTQEKSGNRNNSADSDLRNVDSSDAEIIKNEQPGDSIAVDGEVLKKETESDVDMVGTEDVKVNECGEGATGDQTDAGTEEMLAQDMHLDKEANVAEDNEQPKKENDTKEDIEEAKNKQCNLEKVESSQNELLEKEVDNKKVCEEEREEAKKIDDDDDDNKEVVEDVGEKDLGDDETKRVNGEDNENNEAIEEDNDDEDVIGEDDEAANKEETNKDSKDLEVEKADDDKKSEETPKNKRARSVRDKDQGKDKKHDWSKSREAKDLLNTPSPYVLDRPVRERKTVERLVEVIEKEPDRTIVIEKGRGTPIRDIPNVAHKLIRKKPADLKLIHQTLFGRKGKAVDYKSHILRYSGFVWHESDEKQRAKMKEKLDKCVKDALLDMCHLFDIHVPRTNSRKEDLITKLLDFIAEPHANADAPLSEEEASKSGKRKRVSGGSSTKGSGKRQRKSFEDEDTPMKARGSHEYDSDDEDLEDEAFSGEEGSEDGDGVDEYHYDSGKDTGSGKRASKKSSSAGKEKSSAGSSGKMRFMGKCTTKPSSKHVEDTEIPEGNEKVFSRKRRSSGTPKQVTSSESSGRKATKSKVKSGDSLPDKEDLKKTITDILKKVDFNTATFSDILKKLASHYKMDITPRKEAVKILIQEELTRLAAEANADDEEENEDDNGKGNAPKSKGKQLVS